MLLKLFEPDDMLLLSDDLRFAVVYPNNVSISSSSNLNRP